MNKLQFRGKQVGDDEVLNIHVENILCGKNNFNLVKQTQFLKQKQGRNIFSNYLTSLSIFI